jgi:D-aspartate ligase
VEIEFKRHPLTGRPLLLDVNARMWGWHTLGARAGVDFAWLGWLLARSLAVPELHAAPRVRWVHGTTDAIAALGAWRSGDLSFPAYQRSLRPPRERAVPALYDPLPGLVDLPGLPARGLSRRGCPTRSSPRPSAGTKNTPHLWGTVSLAGN